MQHLLLWGGARFKVFLFFFLRNLGILHVCCPQCHDRPLGNLEFMDFASSIAIVPCFSGWRRLNRNLVIRSKNSQHAKSCWQTVVVFFVAWNFGGLRQIIWIQTFWASTRFAVAIETIGAVSLFGTHIMLTYVDVWCGFSLATTSTSHSVSTDQRGFQHVSTWVL